MAEFMISGRFEANDIADALTWLAANFAEAAGGEEAEARPCDMSVWRVQPIPSTAEWEKHGPA